MQTIDLTLPIATCEEEKLAPDAPWRPTETIHTRRWRIGDGAEAYTARVHYLSHWGMAGTYIDFPGHIVETDDGDDASSVPAEKLFRLEAGVVRLDRASGSGRVSADELAAAGPKPASGQALIVNALGPRRFDEIELRSVYFGSDAVRWIIDTGVHLLVSDIYESDVDPQGVFPALFANGIYTVCCPINLHRISRPVVRVTALPLRVATATQLPCRVVVEQEEL